jgi:NitT/TauT family transport system substrate-binding protein
LPAVRLILPIIFMLFAIDAMAAEPLKVRVGVLKFGTVNWELETMKHHGFDKAEDLDVEIVRLASKQATSVAFQAGDVDLIVNDWFWVSRQRHMGRKFAFMPYSSAAGALMVPANSPIKTLADLKGKRLGIAGGPLDRSWLLVRAVAKRRHGVELDQSVEKVFGAPPLLSGQLENGRLDAVITFWHYAARLEALGMTRLLGVNEASEALGIIARVPQIGYVFRDEWAATNSGAAMAFMRASLKSKALLNESEEEWRRLRPLTKAKDDATFNALKTQFRAGIPASWGAMEWAEAAKLFTILDGLGGAALTGETRRLAAGTFSPDVTFKTP